MNSPQVRLFGIDDAAHANRPERAQLRVYALANRAEPEALLPIRADHEWQVAAASAFQYPADWRGLFSPEPNAVLHDRVTCKIP